MHEARSYFGMSIQPLKEIYDTNRKQRVIIYLTDTGKFSYTLEYFSEDPYEMCWIPIGLEMIGIYDTEETAEIEARANMDWLRGG